MHRGEMLRPKTWLTAPGAGVVQMQRAAGNRGEGDREAAVDLDCGPAHSWAVVPPQLSLAQSQRRP